MDIRRYTRYPLLYVATALVCGLMTGHAYSYATVWLVAAAGLLAVSLLLYRLPVCQSIAILATCLATGGYLMSRAIDGMTANLPQGEVEYEAIIISEPVVHGKVMQADLLIMNGNGGYKAKASILRDTETGRWQQLKVGGGIKARSTLTAPINYPGSTFDYASYLRHHGYQASTFIYSDNWQAAAVDLRRLSLTDRAVLWCKVWRHEFLQRVQDMGIGGQEYAVLAALVLGEKSYLSKDIKDDYSISGASHVLALSGLHLGIIYALLSLLMGRWRRQLIGQTLILVFIWSYVTLVGFSPSVVRSATMLTVYAMVSLLNRDGVSLNTLLLTATIMLLASPLTLYDTGFQMSFLAVLGIVLFYPLIGGLIPTDFLWRHRIVKWVWNMIAVSVAAQLLIFPLVIYHFGRFSCYFLLANFIAIPCATLLLYGAVAFVPLSFVPYVGEWLLRGLAEVVRLMNGGLQLIASLPGASIEHIQWPLSMVVCVYLLIAALYGLWLFLKRVWGKI